MPKKTTTAAQITDVATWSLVPVGAGGLDEFTDESALLPDFLRRADNVSLARGTLDRRKGAIKLYKAASTGGSKTFGAVTKYGTITAASQLEIPAGGFALYLHFVATRPSAGNTAYILSSRVNAQSYHVISVTLDENGVITATVEFTADSATSTACTAVAAGATVHYLLIFDAVSGTLTAYVNGAASGTPATGITVTDKPVAATGTNWHVGVHYNPAVAGVVANTNFDGALDGFVLMSLRGLRPASGTTTFAQTLIKHSARQWPNPMGRGILCFYDFDGSSTTTATDRSRFKNNMALTGTPSNTAAVALDTLLTNFIGRSSTPNGRKVNWLGNAGRLFYENTAAATS